MEPWKIPLRILVIVAAPLGACYTPHRPAVGEHEDGTHGTSDASSTTTASASDGVTSAATSVDTFESGEDATWSGESDSGTTSDEGCGNGIVEEPETCDDGDGVDGNGCNNDCNPSGQTLWTVTYDGAAHLVDWPTRIAVASDDSVVIAGYEGALPADLPLLHRYDANGKVHWRQTFLVAGGGGEATGVALTADDIVVVSAHDATASGGVIARFALEDGALEDELPTLAVPYDVVVRTDGRMFACGSTTMGPDAGRLWTAAYSEFGNQLWEVVDGEGMQGAGLSLALVEDDGIVVLGSRDHATILDRRDADGNRLWVNTFGLNGKDVSGAPAQGVVLTGSAGRSDAFVSVFDGDGVVAWMDVADLGQSSGSGIAFDSAGNFVVAGSVYNNAFSSDALVLKYDPGGTLLWSQHWDISNDSPLDSTHGMSVATDSTDAILLTGQFRPNDSDATDIWVRKLTP